MTTELINLLSSQSGQWYTLRSIQNLTGLSLESILNQVEILRKSGYWIEISPALGYRLHPNSTGLTYDRIELELTTRRIGRRLLVYQETDSTNDVVWSYASELAYGRHDYDGLAVFADHQRTGRGRLGRSWFSMPGAALLGSVLIYDDIARRKIVSQALSIAAGISAAQAIDETGGIDTQIKWPNDVLWQSMKLAGVMVESRQIGEEWAYVLGIGINCSMENEHLPPDLIGRAVSIRQVTGQPVDREKLAQALLLNLDHWLSGLSSDAKTRRNTIKELHEIWVKKCINIGNRLTLIWNNREFCGRVVDVDIEHGLLMQLDSGGVRLFDASTTTVKPE